MTQSDLSPSPDTVLGKRLLTTSAQDSPSPTSSSTIAVTGGAIVAKDNASVDGEVIEELMLTATWNGAVQRTHFRPDNYSKKFVLQTPAACTVGELKSRLSDLTSVKPERMKLMGFVKGRLPADDIVLGALKLKKNHAFMMMGTGIFRIG
ncbi:hypothetical protein HDV00_001538 [Rhizophlyctis rosea]|nr:hypothetical protein HDV00_001538 [Rhizophlyctis rosea]